MRTITTILLILSSVLASGQPMKAITSHKTPAAAAGFSPTVVGQFNFSLTSRTESGWVNVAGHPHTAVRTGTDGTSGVGVSSIATARWNPFSSATAAQSGGESVANPTFAFPANVVLDYWFHYSLAFTAGVDDSTDANLEINGLIPGVQYKIEILGSRDDGAVAAATRQMRVICWDNSSQTEVDDFNVKGNTANLITFDTRVARGNGKLLFWIGRAAPTNADHQFGYINGVRITQLTE